MGLRDAPTLDNAHMSRAMRDTSVEGTAANGGSSASSVAAPLLGRADSGANSGANSDDGQHSDLATEWTKRKAQFFAHFKAFSDGDKAADAQSEQVAPTSESSAESKCHVCNVALRLLRLRHHCRNCGLAVCGVHSKNQVPLPHLGIMKEVRVCDICTRQLVQRRAGYRSPRRRSGSSHGRPSIDDDDFVMSPLAADAAKLSGNSTSTFSLSSSPVPVSSSSTLSSASSSSSTIVAAGADAASAQLFGHMDGIIYSCTLEEQDNTVDDILYLGTFTMGGRSFVSRRMSANVAIWKDRTFMLTSAEMLCFKALEDEAALGEVRSSVHLTEILHVEVSDQYPRILTAIRSDGRIFRIRAKTPAQCSEIAVALKRAIRAFQDAMYKLQRGPQPEDNCISCVTLQHESSLPEQVVVAAPRVGDTFDVDMYPSSILRLYVNGPGANGVALCSREMLARRALQRDHVIEADQLPSAVGTGASDHSVLHVTLRADDKRPSARAQETRRQFWSVVALLVALAFAMQMARVKSLELLAWLVALVLVLLRFHTPIRLLATTKRLHVYRTFRVTCTHVAVVSKRNSDDECASSDDATNSSTQQQLQLLADRELDSRFLEGCNGDVEDAKRRFVETMQWRQANAIDAIFFRPSPHFDVLKDAFVNYAHKKDRLGHVVSIEYLGAMKQSMEHFLKAGVTEDDAVMHNILLQEFLWRVVDPRPYPEGVMLKILDIKGISMSDVSGDVFNYMKRLGEIVAEYNPERIYQVFIVHPPSWFNFIWKLVSPLINPKTRERMHVLRGAKDIQKALLEFVAPENLPVEYGGTCSCVGGCATHSPEETDLRAYMAFVNSGTADDATVRARFAEMCAKYHAQLPPWEADATATSPSSSVSSHDSGGAAVLTSTQTEM